MTAQQLQADVGAGSMSEITRLSIANGVGERVQVARFPPLAPDAPTTSSDEVGGVQGGRINPRLYQPGRGVLLRVRRPNGSSLVARRASP